MTFSLYERFNCPWNPLYGELHEKSVLAHADIKFQIRTDLIIELK